MKIRSRVNGNILTMSDDKARPLVRCGLFEVFEERGAAPSEVAETGEDDEGTERKSRRTYRRKDLVAEE